MHVLGRTQLGGFPFARCPSHGPSREGNYFPGASLGYGVAVGNFHRLAGASEEHGSSGLPLHNSKAGVPDRSACRACGPSGLWAGHLAAAGTLTAPLSGEEKGCA